MALTSFEVTGKEASAPLKSRLRASLIAGMGQAGYDVLDTPQPGKRHKQLHVKVELVGSSTFGIAVELRDADGKPLAKVSDSCQVCTVTEAAEVVQGAPALLRMKRTDPVPVDSAATARAKELYRKGEMAFQIGNFNEAAQKFQESYAEAPVPKLLWNIAQALRRQYELDHDLMKLRRAAAVLRNFRGATGDNEELARAEAEQKKPGLSPTADQPPTQPPNAVVVEKQPDPRPEKKPLWKSWGLWAGVGVAAGAALIVGLGVGLAAGAHEDFWTSAQTGCTGTCSLLDLRP